ncbi:hypothetical protein HHK36_025757 [Tetracentron sinense]|uniref:Uncharacterized protein n=1 Tax=Tetracentron sinense TaxID=13715 RepID=A0A835D5V5_TETSI|nr:hypothetical protein HHK36_025757 [Tetracentron sinense]
MSINLQSQAFAENLRRSKTPKPGYPYSPNSALETLKFILLDNTHEGSSPNFKLLPFRKGKPLACSSGSTDNSPPVWHLGWISLADCLVNSEIRLSEVSCNFKNVMIYIHRRDQAKALIEWHNTSRFCGHCGERTVAMGAGRRKQCSNESCNKRIYPRVDPLL